MKKTLIRTIACIAGAALIAALGRTCNNNQTTQNMNPTYPMQVDSTELLTMSYFVPLLPSQANASITSNTAISSDHIFRAENYTKGILKIKAEYHSQSDMRSLYGKVRD